MNSPFTATDTMEKYQSDSHLGSSSLKAGRETSFLVNRSFPNMPSMSRSTSMAGRHDAAVGEPGNMVTVSAGHASQPPPPSTEKEAEGHVVQKAEPSASAARPEAHVTQAAAPRGR